MTRTIIDLKTGQARTEASTPEAFPTEQGVPREITKVQFVRAMRAAGHWDTHSAAIEAHPDWPYITALPRNDALTLAAAAAIGATDAEMDAIWIAGAAL